MTGYQQILSDTCQAVSIVGQYEGDEYARVLTIVDLPESTLPMMATLSSAGDTAPGLALSLTTTSAVALSARQEHW